MNLLTYLISITVITSLWMYLCDCTIRGLCPQSVPAVADFPVQNLKS